MFIRDSSYIEALFRALVETYPLPSIKIKDDVFEIISHKLIDKDYEMNIGKVINIENEKAYIKTADGILIINLLRNFKTKEKIFPNEILKIGTSL